MEEDYRTETEKRYGAFDKCILFEAGSAPIGVQITTTKKGHVCVIVCAHPKTLRLKNLNSVWITDGYGSPNVQYPVGNWSVRIIHSPKAIHIYCSRRWWPSWLFGAEKELHVEAGAAADISTANYSATMTGTWFTQITGR